jgi:hypothetical protein
MSRLAADRAFPTDLALVTFSQTPSSVSQSRPWLDETMTISIVLFKRFAAMGFTMAPAVIDQLFAD